MQTAATFARLKDQTWGLRVNGPRPVEGAAVTVAKRDGSTKSATVARILWHGTAKDGREASLCSITESGGRDSYGNRTGNGDSYRAGVRAPHRRVCDYCGSCECSRAWNKSELCDED